MNWTLPGTTLPIDREDADRTEGLFQSLFLAGGLTLSQVASVTGLEPYTIQNWVKRGFLPPPVKKRYNMEQVCRIISIHMLRPVLSLEEICQLIRSINGSLTDESDDTIDDTKLYFMFTSLAARARHIGGSEEWDGALEEVMADYQEPVPGAKDRILRVLRIMLTAWMAAQLRTQVDAMMGTLTVDS